MIIRLAAAAAITAGALLGPAAVAAGPAAAATADCHVYNVLVSTPVVHGRARIRASATAICTTRPRSFHAQISIQQHVPFQGRLRWVTVTLGPVDRTIPAPRRRYSVSRHCLPGTYRTVIVVGGRPRDGQPSANRAFRSVPLIIRGCVAGNAHPWEAIT